MTFDAKTWIEAATLEGGAYGAMLETVVDRDLDDADADRLLASIKSDLRLVGALAIECGASIDEAESIVRALGEAAAAVLRRASLH